MSQPRDQVNALTRHSATLTIAPAFATWQHGNMATWSHGHRWRRVWCARDPCSASKLSSLTTTHRGLVSLYPPRRTRFPRHLCLFVGFFLSFFLLSCFSYSFARRCPFNFWANGSQADFVRWGVSVVDANESKKTTHSVNGLPGPLHCTNEQTNESINESLSEWVAALVGSQLRLVGRRVNPRTQESFTSSTTDCEVLIVKY